MENSKKDIGLILAIAFASAAVSGSLVFFGLQFGNNNDLKVSVLDAQIDEAVERYVEKKQLEAEEQMAVAAEEETRNSAELAKNVMPISEDDHVFGNKDAKITLIEYSDFHCGFCKKFHPIAKEILAMYEGDVNWVYRHYPLGYPQRAAMEQALASECAGEIGGSEKFWEYAQGIFDEGPADDVALIALAEKLGLDGKAFEACLSNDKYLEKIAAQRQNGMDSGVQGTPGTFVYNNETGEVYLVKGAQSASMFANIIDEMI